MHRHNVTCAFAALRIVRLPSRANVPAQRTRADEYIRCRWGDKTAMRPFAKLFWTLVCCIVQADKIFTSDGLGSAKGLVLKLDSLTSPALE